jgi:murein DD-endopeptidase MepM/ murein hydrolase activator NlpD
MMRTRRALTTLLALAGALLAIVGAQPGVAGAADRYTPLVPQVMSTPRWFVGADGKIHIAYELELTNGFPVPADGNYVILSLGAGRYAFYAHLKPGSITVRPGQRVTVGQQIARLGNSGSSSGPHLHFQLMTKPSALASDGLPFVFKSFSLRGTIPPLTDSLAATIAAGKPIPINPAGAGPRTNELPLGRDVIDF